MSPIRVGDADQAVLDRIFEVIEDSENIEALVAQINARNQTDSHAARLAHVESELARIDRAVSRLLDLAEDDLAPAAEIAGRMAQRREEREALQAEKLDLLMEQTGDTMMSAEAVRERLCAARAGLMSREVAEQRQALRALLECVEYDGEKLTLIFR